MTEAGHSFMASIVRNFIDFSRVPMQNLLEQEELLPLKNEDFPESTAKKADSGNKNPSHDGKESSSDVEQFSSDAVKSSSDNKLNHLLKESLNLVMLEDDSAGFEGSGFGDEEFFGMAMKNDEEITPLRFISEDLQPARNVISNVPKDGNGANTSVTGSNKSAQSRLLETTRLETSENTAVRNNALMENTVAVGKRLEENSIDFGRRLEALLENTIDTSQKVARNHSRVLGKPTRRKYRKWRRRRRRKKLRRARFNRLRMERIRMERERVRKEEENKEQGRIEQERVTRSKRSFNEEDAGIETDRAKIGLETIMRVSCSPLGKLLLHKGQLVLVIQVN